SGPGAANHGSRPASTDGAGRLEVLSCFRALQRRSHGRAHRILLYPLAYGAQTMSRNRSVPVLMYHHVSPVDGMITVSPANFEQQLLWLKRRNYRTLTSAEFAQHLDGAPAPARSVLITFDDGYLDNWVYAYPLLKKYGYTAMVFLVTSWVGDGPPRHRLGQGELPETPSHRDCEASIEQGRSDDVILRWSEIKAMRDDGVMEFHSHTHTHTRWDLLEPQEKNSRMAQELALSRAALRDNLGE